ncbi:MAG TPA: hypothetical protein VE218_10875 [Acidobacteriaceae bacterium]|nr:hypothetical protein [Acidobacteriaceae bacterium]
MKRNGLPTVACATFVFIVALAAAWPLEVQDAKSPYPNMAPLGQYLMDRNAEIALARSAAPESVSKDAEVMVLGPKGYEIAVNGSNGFVCLVHRSWTSKIDDPEFWNPRRRGPMCLNATAAKFYLPNTILRTNLVLAGRSKAEVFAAIDAAFEKKEFPPLELGAMCYMMSKQGYLNDRGGRWHPHLMFFLPPGTDAAWGANLPGSPILADDDTADRMTVFMVPIATWSDGTPDSVESADLSSGGAQKHTPRMRRLVL